MCFAFLLLGAFSVCCCHMIINVILEELYFLFASDTVRAG